MEQVNAMELPMGFGMALAKNSDAMARFAAMPKAQQTAVLEGTHGIASKAEMEQYVARLTLQ